MLDSVWLQTHFKRRHEFATRGLWRRTDARKREEAAQQREGSSKGDGGGTRRSRQTFCQTCCAFLRQHCQTHCSGDVHVLGPAPNRASLNYLERPIDFCRARLCGFRNRTPSPPPLSSTKTMPAASNAWRRAASLASVTGISPSTTSALRIVATPTFEAVARSSAVQRSKARAARI